MEPETTVVATKTTEEQKDSSAPSQETKPKYTEAETAAYNFKKQAERAKELGLDPAELLGITPVLNINPNDSDDEPLTVGKLREIQTKDAQESALRMVDAIADETERASVKKILEENIKPSGNAAKDFALAQAAVNATKNARIAEEQFRKGNPMRTAAGGGGAIPREDDFVPTPEEQVFMAKPYNLSKEKIIALRTKG